MNVIASFLSAFQLFSQPTQLYSKDGGEFFIFFLSLELKHDGRGRVDGLWDGKDALPVTWKKVGTKFVLTPTGPSWRMERKEYVGESDKPIPVRRTLNRIEVQVLAGGGKTYQCSTFYTISYPDNPKRAAQTENDDFECFTMKPFNPPNGSVIAFSNRLLHLKPDGSVESLNSNGEEISRWKMGTGGLELVESKGDRMILKIQEKPEVIPQGLLEYPDDKKGPSYYFTQLETLSSDYKSLQLEPKDLIGKFTLHRNDGTLNSLDYSFKSDGSGSVSWEDGSESVPFKWRIEGNKILFVPGDGFTVLDKSASRLLVQYVLKPGGGLEITKDTTKIDSLIRR